MRAVTGELKVITWWAGHGGGNSLVIKHGNCIVLYAHFKQDTMSEKVAYPGAKVTAGQYLARMGNSGSSSGPHLHIHASRISSFATAEELIEMSEQGTLSNIGPRPIPFDGARAMRLSFMFPGGEINPLNAFSTMWASGPYFERYGIRPTWVYQPPIELGFKLRNRKVITADLRNRTWTDWDRHDPALTGDQEKGDRPYSRVKIQKDRIQDSGLERD